jgi:hypothetical protein
MKNPSVHNLVEDIYNTVSTKQIPEGVDAEAEIERFGESMKDLMRIQFSEYERDRRALRLSAVGQPARKLWHRLKGTPQEKILPHTYVKFLYGHVIEEMLVFLARLSGHEVTDQQKQCEVEGITGHMDCRIDGVLTDVKSASSRSFKKFKDGSLVFDDPFGYVAQIKAYAASEGDTRYGWLAMDKQNGHLTYLLYDEEAPSSPDLIKYDIKEKIRSVKKLEGRSTPPSLCHETLEDGKSGNRRLAAGCSYCEYKQSCYPTLRAFAYSGGPRFLTEVVREPNVPEIKLTEVVNAEENT